MVFGRAAHLDAARPEAFHGTTQRDIHVSEAGQSLPPEGPNTATRIAVWRPIPEKVTIRPQEEPTSAQKEQLEELKAYVEKELLLPESDPYAKWERRFLANKDTYPRYMRASKWNMQEAQRRIKGTLEWRRSYKPDLIPPTEIEEEAQGGKVVVNGFDIHGRPVVWLRPSRENTKPSPTQVRHLIWQLERAIDIMPEGVEKLALVIDYKGATSSNNPPVATAKEVISILQNHYCERLGRAVVMNVPWYLNGFFSIVKPFLDPATKDKIKFNPEMTDLVTSEQLDSEFGGEHQYHYDPRVYLPALCSYCGIKQDGTREEHDPRGDTSPKARPEEIQRKLTSQYAEHDAIAEEAREEVNQQEAQAAATSAPMQEDTPVQEGVISTDHAAAAPIVSTAATTGSTDHSAPVASNTALYGAGATAVGASSIGVAVAMMHMQNKKQASSTSTTEGITPVSDVRATDSEPVHGTPMTSAGNVEPISAEPALESRTVELADTPQAVGPVESAPATAADKAESSTMTNHHTTNAQAVQPEVLTSSTPAQPPAMVENEKATHTTPAGATVPAVAANPTSRADQKKKKGGFMAKLKGMCCGKKAAQDAYEEKPAATPVAPVAPVTPSAPVENDNSTLIAEPSKNKVKIAPEAAESKPYTNAPLPTNATFGPEAYQTAMETTEAEDYFASDLRKAEAKPHHQGADDAKMETRPAAIMERLHTGGSGDLVLAFEVKQPPREVDEHTAASEASAQPTSKA